MNKLILFMFLYECIGFSCASEIRVFKYIAMAEAMASVGNVVEGVPDFLEVGYYEIGRKGFVVVNRNYKGECIIDGDPDRYYSLRAHFAKYNIRYSRKGVRGAFIYDQPYGCDSGLYFYKLSKSRRIYIVGDAYRENGLQFLTAPNFRGYVAKSELPAGWRQYEPDDSWFYVVQEVFVFDDLKKNLRNPR